MRLSIQSLRRLLTTMTGTQQLKMTWFPRSDLISTCLFRTANYFSGKSAARNTTVYNTELDNLFIVRHSNQDGNVQLQPRIHNQSRHVEILDW